MTFAETLREAIASAHLTQKAAAEYLGTPLRTLESWLGGKRIPPQYTQESVLNKLNEIK